MATTDTTTYTIEPEYLTDIVLYKNVPLYSPNKVILFKNKNERSEYFNLFEKIELGSLYNFMRFQQSVKLPLKYESSWGYNYISWKDSKDDIQMFGFIPNYDYVRTGLTEFTIQIDVLTTFCLGDFLAPFNNLQISRQMISKAEFSNNGVYYKSQSSDTIQIPSGIVGQDAVLFDDAKFIDTSSPISNLFKSSYVVVFSATADLEADFGKIDESTGQGTPRISSAPTVTYDMITSANDLLVCDYENWVKLISTNLKDYPYISKNIQSAILIPKLFFVGTVNNPVTDNDFEPITVGKNTASWIGKDRAKVYRFKNNKSSQEFDWFRLKYSDLLSTEFSQPIEQEFFRTPYFSIDTTDWHGQVVQLSPELLPDITNPNGYLQYHCQMVLGHLNSFGVYPLRYNSFGNEKARWTYTSVGSETTTDQINIVGQDKGEYLNVALMYSDFNEIPVPYDSFKLSIADKAYSRDMEYAQTNMGQADRASGRSIPGIRASANDKYVAKLRNYANTGMEAANNSMMNGMQSGDIFGGAKQAYTDRLMANANSLTEASDFWTSLDNSLASDKYSHGANASSGSSTTGVAFNMKNRTLGVGIKYRGPLNTSQYNMIKRYYRTMGYLCNYSGKAESLFTHKYMNFITCTGNYTLDNMDPNLMSMIRSLLETGVQFWHYQPGVKDPFQIDLVNNIRIS